MKASGRAGGHAPAPRRITVSVLDYVNVYLVDVRAYLLYSLCGRGACVLAATTAVVGV